MKTSKPPTTSEIVKKRLRNRLKAMGEQKPFVIGSLTKIYRKCGNPKCQCAQENGRKHPAHLLTTKVKGKTRGTYVPVDLVDDVKEWCEQYRSVKKQIKGVSECCEELIKMHVKEKRAAKRS